MVQCMEAWFLADKDCLATYYGNDFNQNALPARLDIEKIPKNDVLNGLKNATRSGVSKGEYEKGQHSFDILALIDPDKVIAASPYAKRLVDTLKAKPDNWPDQHLRRPYRAPLHQRNTHANTLPR